MTLSQLLIPLYVLISLGVILKYYRFFHDQFWLGLERLTYYILFPALLFVGLAKAPVNVALLWNIVLVIMLPTLFIGFSQWLGFLSPSLLPATFTSMYQGAVRNNTPMVLVMIPLILPEKGLAIVAVVIFIMVPFNNIVSVLALNHYGNLPKEQQRKWWKGIISNPLIIACIAGITLNISGLKLPESLLNTGCFLGHSALPLALLAVGAGLKISNFLTHKLAIILSSMAKLLILPSVTWGICVLFNVDAEIAKTAILYTAVSTAPSGFILAKQMGGDADTMAQIITAQTLLAALTLPLFLNIALQY
jgi:predicted permease